MKVILMTTLFSGIGWLVVTLSLLVTFHLLLFNFPERYELNSNLKHFGVPIEYDQVKPIVIILFILSFIISIVQTVLSFIFYTKGRRVLQTGNPAQFLMYENLIGWLPITLSFRLLMAVVLFGFGVLMLIALMKKDDQKGQEDQPMVKTVKLDQDDQQNDQQMVKTMKLTLILSILLIIGGLSEFAMFVTTIISSTRIMNNLGTLVASP